MSHGKYLLIPERGWRRKIEDLKQTCQDSCFVNRFSQEAVSQQIFYLHNRDALGRRARYFEIHAHAREHKERKYDQALYYFI